MTANQRAAADPNVSAWVSASAGTGKTHVLTSRVLRLLLSGATPDRLLCLTFTKAAAAQMANRIHRQLAQWTTAGDDKLMADLESLDIKVNEATKARARKLFAEVLDLPGGLKIATIHAFCQALLARFPLEAALPPHFDTLDERSAAEAVSEAVDGMLARAESDHEVSAALDRIARRLSEFSFPDLMREIQDERGALERLARAHITRDGFTAAIRRVLGLRVDETAAEVRQAAGDERAFDGNGLRALAAAYAMGSEAEQKRGDVIARWIEDAAQRAATLDDYVEVFLTKNGEPRNLDKSVTKKTSDRLPQGKDIFAAEQARLAAVCDRLKLIEVADNSVAMLSLALAFLDLYDDEKRRRAVLDYDDLILATLRLLATPGIAPWVLYKLDGGLDHVLIDEAQDTNPEQWRVIKALADEFFAGAGAREEKRTVFAVGDVKQSIYSFQGADPREFAAARDHFSAKTSAAGETFRDLPLDLSFRSAPAVLRFVDEVFADDGARAGLLDPHYHGHDTVRQGAAGLIELWPPEAPAAAEDSDGWLLPFAVDDRLGPEARLARRIARTIKGWLDDHVMLPSRDRPIRAGDILILVRRRTAFDQVLISALKDLGIPVAGADRMVVTDPIAVMDLMALARFALLPEDDLTLATVLKSPLIGLDEEMLFALAYDRGRRSLWAALQEASAPALVAARDYLASIMTRADYQPPFEFFADILTLPDAEGRSGRARILARLGEEANDPLDEFLALAVAYEAAHTPSLQGFLHWLEARPVEIKRDSEEARDEVRIMTVHGAKGLQAPIVILPDTCQMPSFGSRLLWLPHPAGEGIIPVWPGSSDNERGPCAQARAEQTARGMEEQMRLLYVALTRAEDRLYIGGWVGPKGKARGCWHDLLADALSRLPESVDVETPFGLVRRYEEAQQAPAKGDGKAVASETAIMPPAWLRSAPPAEPTPPRPLAPSRPADAEPAAASPLQAAALKKEAAVRFRRGHLIHRLLERLPDLPADRRRAAAEAFLSHPAHGLLPDEVAELIGHVLRLIDDPAFAPLFAPGSRAEAPLVGLIGDTPVSGQIDRLCVTEDAVLIVDYKTNRPPPASVAEAPLAYRRQMAAYRRLLQDIYPGRPVRAALLWTDGPTLMELPADALDAISFS